MFDIYNLQKTLSESALPPGFESRQGALLADFARPYVDEITVDTIGNVICHRKGPGKRIIMPAHMDVIGFIATYIDDRGFIRFSPDGGHWPGRLLNTRIKFENGICGTLQASDKVDLEKDTYVSLSMHDLYIDIGAKDRAEAETMVKPGDVASFLADTVLTKGGTIITPYADDLCACIVLLLAMERIQEPLNDLYFVFSVQEEVGTRGAAVAGYRVKPDLCIAVDGTFCGDNPSKTERIIVKMGSGPTIKIKDGGQICNPQAVEFLRKVAATNGITYQDEVMHGGTTDSSAIQKLRGGVSATAISIPMRNLHTPGEMYRVSDAEGAARLLAKACETAY
jgi:putative aminopeptidase FrvX